MAVMVWCQSCRTVIWAYDHEPKYDLRGMVNMLQLPCPECGEIGNFDGWGGDGSDLQMEDLPIYDEWSAMRYIADVYKVIWNPSPNNHWFARPNGRDLTIAVSRFVKSSINQESAS